MLRSIDCILFITYTYCALFTKLVFIYDPLQMMDSLSRLMAIR